MNNEETRTSEVEATINRIRKGENKMDKNTAATVIGGILAAGAAAQPVINGVNGAMGQGDYIALIVAVLTGLFGWFTKIKNSGE